MNNTIMSSKNTFEGGLLMDFAPDNMSSNVMTSALNATLLTFNGNEMLLQNDMGNGRVETARLPDGYVPVGTCEFGDIIYIVSYNPILNKSLIGCFPSPERNISSEETGDPDLTLSSADFLEFDGENLTGKLKATSVKKILYSSKNMNSGDKYIIYSENLYSEDFNLNNSKHLSDYSNSSHQHGTFPKLVKIHVVSIEESGKIVYLDSTTKWYDNNYYISGEGSKNAEGKLDIDSYRTLVSSAYSIFSSKVSGKLALLVELEKITGFSCSWEPYVESTSVENGINYTNYLIHWNFNWTTNDNNINPNGALLLISEWKGLSENNSGKVGFFLKEENNLLTQYFGNEKLSLPTVLTNQGPSMLFTRSYEPENCDNYDSFLTKNYELAKKGLLDIVSNPSKINIDVNFETGLPNIGNYYINGVTSQTVKDENDKFTTIVYNENNEEIESRPLNDDIVNNYFNYPVLKPFTEITENNEISNFIFKIPVSQTIDNYKFDTDIKNLVYHYKIAPTMPYGYLEEFAQEGYIDFSKIGKKDISLTTWKYYNYGNTSTLTWGLDAYTEPGKGISEVVFEFYDNQGLAAAYHSKNKRSYNGVFTEHLILNDSINKYLTNIDHTGKIFRHKGRKVSSKDLMLDGRMYYNDGTWVDKNNINDNTNDKQYDEDDSGIIYSNCLYLVKIIVKYCNKGILGEYIESELEYVYDYRWFWTNNMYNKYYTNTSDFKILYLDLNLNCVANLYGTENFKLENYEYLANPPGNVSNTELYKSLSANIQAISLNKDEPNIKLKITPGLLDDYNTFNLNDACTKHFHASIYLGDKTITNIPEQPKILFTEDPVSINDNLLLPINGATGYSFKPSISKNLRDILKITFSNSENPKELYDENGYDNYKNWFSLSIKAKEEEKTSTKIEYIGSDGTYKTAYQGYTRSMTDVLKNGFELNLKLIHYSKYAYLTKTKQDVSVLRSFVLNTEDLLDYNIKLTEKLSSLNYTPYFDKMLGTSFIDSSSINSTLQLSILNFNYNVEDSKYELIGSTILNSKEIDEDDCDIHEALKSNFDQISKEFRFMFPLGFVVHKEGNVNPNFSNVYDVTNNKDLWNTYYFEGDTLNINGDTLINGLISGLNEEVVEPSKHFSVYSDGIHSKNEGSILEAYTPEILAYLTLLFYLTNEKETSIPYPHNYVYLDKHICSYKNDIIIKIYADSVDESFILMRNMLLGGDNEDNYINEVLKNAFPNNDLSNELKKELKKHQNVKLNLHEYILTKPLEYQADYIMPDSYYNDNSIIVKSIYESIPKTTFKTFLKNEIYAWDQNTKEFKSLSLTRLLRPVVNIQKDDPDALPFSAKFGEVGFGVSLLTINKNLTIDNNNYLMLKSFPNTTSTYTLSTHHINAKKKTGVDRNRNMTNFKNFKFWE